MSVVCWRCLKWFTSNIYGLVNCPHCGEKVFISEVCYNPKKKGK
jgi:DNA-directed RNA polymerase subunit RPC12/RpoP